MGTKILSEMKKINPGIIAAIALVVMSLVACQKSSTSPASKTSQLSFQMQADNAATNLAASPAAGHSLATNSITQPIAGLTFTSAIANISKFKLESKRNGVETEVTSKNLTNVDLFALVPSLANITVDTGTYKEIEIKVMLQKSADTSMIPLKLKGTFTNSVGVVTPIEFDLNDDVIIKAEAENIHVTSTTDFVALIHMHLNRLESGVTTTDLEAATLTNNTIVISSTSNTSIYEHVLANLSSCGESEMKEHHKDGNEH
jgi:hypothetical protein